MTVAIADQIIVVDGGRITEQGTRRDIMASGGYHARLLGIQARASQG